MFKTLRPALTLCIALLQLEAHATCSREDVDHYLDKGFNPDQITVLCQPTVAPSTGQQTNQSTAIPSHATLTDVLTQSLDVKNLSVSDTHIYYTHRHCLAFGAKTQQGTTKQFCPMFDYTIALENLEIVSIKKKKLFTKEKVMTLKTQVSKQLSNGDTYKQLKQKLIDQYIAEEDTVQIPLHADAPLKKLTEELSREQDTTGQKS